MSNLVIVESPSKAKTIEKILGKDFFVKSSFGHVRDLDKGKNGVDVENGFTPKYIVSKDKSKVIKELKAAAKKATEVWLATDEDREGEAISWHLCKVLGLDEKTTKRIVFREITKPAIQKAIKEPRTVDLNLVNAQQARRILDRLVGFELSELLWRKVKNNLSAGRVQSVAVKLIVEKERAILDFNSTAYYKVTALFFVKDKSGKVATLKAELANNFEQEGDANEFLNKCIGAEYKIKDIKVKPLQRKPAPPFTTSTLQQDASRKLYFSVNRTMSVAQKLYEQGLITYMRTDSTILSDLALGSIANEIKSEYGDEYLEIRKYKTKSDTAQEAHEAIRPTYINRKSAGSNSDEERLYKLIWARTMASQMANARLEKTIVDIGISTVGNQYFKAEGEVMKFDGFLRLYIEGKDDDNGNHEAKGILPPLSVGQVLALNEMIARQRFKNPPARYTEAGLVKKMEELGIGRPSTYAPTITKIMQEGRGYVIKANTEGEERKYKVLTLKQDKISKAEKVEMAGAIKNRLMATDMGMIVTDFLSNQFENIMNYGFTAEMEAEFDKIALGKEDWSQMLKNFYSDFHEAVTKSMEHADRASGERILGKDPETGRTVLVRMSRFGKPIVQIGKPEELAEDEKPRYANLRPNQSLTKVTFEEVMPLFELPRNLGEYEGKEVIIGEGRFGPYVKYDDGFVSLPKGSDPFGFTMEDSIALIKQKQKENEAVFEFKGQPVTKGKGRFGPFFKWNGMFINIPRRFDPETISIGEAKELIEAKIEKEANRYIHNWPDEKISVENGRWGPFIKFKKKNISFAKKKDGTRVTSEEAKEYTLDFVKELIVKAIPDAFPKKKTPAKKKPAAKKKTTTKKK